MCGEIVRVSLGACPEPDWVKTQGLCLGCSLWQKRGQSQEEMLCHQNPRAFPLCSVECNMVIQPAQGMAWEHANPAVDKTNSSPTPLSSLPKPFPVLP